MHLLRRLREYHARRPLPQPVSYTHLEVNKRQCVRVFMADVKGDLSGLAAPGSMTPRLESRLQALGVTEFAPAKCPVTFWDVFGAQGHPVRATISDMGLSLIHI